METPVRLNFALSRSSPPESDVNTDSACEMASGFATPNGGLERRKRPVFHSGLPVDLAAFHMFRIGSMHTNGSSHDDAESNDLPQPVDSSHHEVTNQLYSATLALQAIHRLLTDGEVEKARIAAGNILPKLLPPTDDP